MPGYMIVSDVYAENINLADTYKSFKEKKI